MCLHRGCELGLQSSDRSDNTDGSNTKQLSMHSCLLEGPDWFAPNSCATGFTDDLSDLGEFRRPARKNYENVPPATPSLSFVQCGTLISAFFVCSKAGFCLTACRVDSMIGCYLSVQHTWPSQVAFGWNLVCIHFD